MFAPQAAWLLRKRHRNCLKIFLVILCVFCYIKIYLSGYILRDDDEFARLGIFATNMAKERDLAIFQLTPWIVEKTIQEGACGISSYNITVGIVFVVKSAISHIERRQAIRRSWGGVRLFDDFMLDTIFVLGATSDEEAQERVERENMIYGDILQFDLEDTPEFLLEKVMAGMQWASILPQNWMYASIDDDISINFPIFVEYFRDLFQNYTSEGVLRHDDIPIVCVYSYQARDPPARAEDSKWYMPKTIYPGEYWPIYCRGGMYMISSIMTKYLHKITRRTARLYLDDVWITGINRLKLMKGNTNIVPAKFSVMTDIEFFDDINFNDVIVKHFWGNIVDREVDVPRELAIAWNALEPTFYYRILCQSSSYVHSYNISEDYFNVAYEVGNSSARSFENSTLYRNYSTPKDS